MTLVINGFATSQASATCATLAPCARPTSRIFSTTLKPNSLSKGIKSKPAKRFPFSFSFCWKLSRVYFPLRNPTGQRTPHRHAGASGAQKGHEFVFEIAREQRVIHLSAGETRPAALFLNGKRRGRLPCWPIGKTEIADLSGAHEIV